MIEQDLLFRVLETSILDMIVLLLFLRQQQLAGNLRQYIVVAEHAPCNIPWMLDFVFDATYWLLTVAPGCILSILVMAFC